MASILFVEDHLGLIEELVQLLLRRRGAEELALRFTRDIASAMNRLKEEKFDVIVLDVMLPSFPGVPAHEEGIYLASWLLGYTKRLPPSLQKCEAPDWIPKCSLVFLTSRTARPVQDALERLTQGKVKVPVIERLPENVDDQATEILKLLGAASVGRI